MTSFENHITTQALHMHAVLACRDNASTVTIKAMARLGRPLPESLAASILTLGNLHAPITQACRLWNLPHDNFSHKVWKMHKDGRKIPGWGGSFAPEGEPDPVLTYYDEHMPPAFLVKRDEMTAQVQYETGRNIFPNAALYTAMFADLLALTPEAAPELVLRGRLDTLCFFWKESYVNTVQ